MYNFSASVFPGSHLFYTIPTTHIREPLIIVTNIFVHMFLLMPPTDLQQDKRPEAKTRSHCRSRTVPLHRLSKSHIQKSEKADSISRIKERTTDPSNKKPWARDVRIPGRTTYDIPGPGHHIP